jgi:hypothetical protein
MPGILFSTSGKCCLTVDLTGLIFLVTLYKRHVRYPGIFSVYL